MSAILKFDFQKRKQLHFSEENYLNYKKQTNKQTNKKRTNKQTPQQKKNKTKQNKTILHVTITFP